MPFNKAFSNAQVDHETRESLENFSEIFTENENAKSASISLKSITVISFNQFCKCSATSIPSYFWTFLVDFS